MSRIHRKVATATGLAIGTATGALVTSGPVAQAAPSYQGGPIAFTTGNGTSWTVVNGDGSNVRQVTPSGGGFSSGTAVVAAVAYSPDGKQVAFTATPNGVPSTGNTGVWVANPDGTGAHRVADQQQNFGTKPAWSPDGSTVYFSTSSGTGLSQGTVDKVRADGSSPAAPAFSDPGCGDHLPQTTHQGYLFFQRTCAFVPGGGTAQQLGGYAIFRPGDNTPEKAFADGLPSSISPDGTRYAMAAQEPDPAQAGASIYGIRVNPMGDNSVSPLFAKVPAGHVINVLTYAPGGDIVFADMSSAPAPGGGNPVWTSVIESVGDAPNALPHVITTVAAPVESIDAVNGAPAFGSRPVADRIGGGDRIATSVDASRWSYDAYGSGGRRANAAVLSRSDTFADALGGTALALQARGPLLLTPTNSLDQNVANELTRILAPGSTVYILGGGTAISPAVEAKVKAMGFQVQRLGGANRYATAVAIAESFAYNAPDTVMIATGADYPDALAAGVAAGQDRETTLGWGARGGVVLLTNGTSMPPETAKYLATIDPHKASVYSVGGQAVKAVATAFPAWSGAVTPLAGANRYETAAKVATSVLFGGGAPGRYSMVGVATGGNWPDALSGGALIGNQGGPLLLADMNGVVGGENAVLTANHLQGLAVFGGTSVVSDNAAASIADTAFGPGAWDAQANRAAPALP